MNSEEGDMKREKSSEVPFWRVVISVIQASFGVQSDANRQRDFGQTKFMPFVVAAVLFTSLFVLVLMLVVKMVLSGA